MIWACKYNIPFNAIECGMTEEGEFSIRDELKNPTAVTKNHNSNIQCINENLVLLLNKKTLF